MTLLHVDRGIAYEKGITYRHSKDSESGGRSDRSAHRQREGSESSWSTCF